MKVYEEQKRWGKLERMLPNFGTWGEHVVSEDLCTAQTLYNN